ncbi:hypothetical protein [Tengunoibacter tsumagoiensis]|uniref:Uncharacterized protein n=1 Tax=Tengunoibacter tsumagoiensis TaxID=2014871 RepID=A0A402A2U5_9CHLR|nr:hypothetical protein [Tengunoibacter tsumagoiensis]GCE13460.1 hypothetical protein KTT_33190 [Tengunoibacter tsumagoiensis]
MTLPPPDARSPRSMPRRPTMISPTHSNPSISPLQAASAASLPPLASAYEYANDADHEHAINFATHSWDLATGGLKTLTAKRELPIRPERRAADLSPEVQMSSRSYLLVLVILLCIVFMLIGGGIVLFVMIQP